MNEKEIAKYVEMMAAQLRRMPLADSVMFLQGACAVAGDHPAMDGLRGTLRDMVSADDQLEALSGQLKLNLGLRECLEKLGKDGK